MNYMKNIEKLLEHAIEQGGGIFRLFPNWVSREFCIPGRRLKLHPDDYYAYGVHRGGIDERWFASTTKADNGPETLQDEGLSYIYLENEKENKKILLKDVIDAMGNEIIGKEIMNKYHCWPMYSKFFDNLEPLPLHLHHNDEHAAKVGQKSKPEGYYFPEQLNNHSGYFPHTYFGLNPGTTKDKVRQCLKNWDKGDNRILQLSKAYKLELGTGWLVPPGVLHAPGSLLTYEPQFASDVFAMFQNITWDRYIPRDLLVKDVPNELNQDLDYIISLIDWELNLDPDFHQNRFLEPKPIEAIDEMRAKGYEEYYVVYGNEHFSAKKLTIFPKRSVFIKEKTPYGLIVIQGHGKFGKFKIESPSMIRFGQMTNDELFITYDAAVRGVKITNESNRENLVILKHLGPEL